MPVNDEFTAEECEHQPLIQQLQEMYDMHIQDEQDLGAIRQQLSQTSSLPVASSMRGKTFHRATNEENQGIIVHPSGFPSHHKTFWSKSLSILAATLIVALLTGFFMLARSHQSVSTQSATTKISNSARTGSAVVSTPCNQSYPITGTIINVTSSTLNAHAGGIQVKGSKQQFQGLLGATFTIAIGPNTQFFEQQENGCHAVSRVSIREGQRIYASPPKEILQSYPPILMGVDKLVFFLPGS